MLGWEFPPVINGGLGVACHDLAAAMSEHADITMVIPKASPGFKMSRLKLVGANNLDPKKLNYPGIDLCCKLPFKITEVLADLAHGRRPQAELRLECQVRADEDAAERVRVVAIVRLAILAMVSGFQAHVVRAARIPGFRGTDHTSIHRTTPVAAPPAC